MTKKLSHLSLALWVSLMGLMFAVPGLAAAAEAAGTEEKALDPAEEFALPPWISIHVFGIDMSINKAVFYVILAAVLTVVATLMLVTHVVVGLVTLGIDFVRPEKGAAA